VKKIYTLTLLTITIISTTTCMEMQRPRKRSTCEEEAQFPSISPSAVVPVYINSMPQVMSNKNEIELVPIYRTVITSTNNTAPTKKQITQDEHKPFLHTSTPVKLNEELIKQLYDKALDISEDFRLDKFSHIVTLMNNAKNNNIDEDVMGKYSYKLGQKQHIDESYDIFEKRKKLIKPILFFGFLKSYNLKINTTKECLPNINDIATIKMDEHIGNKLAKQMGLSSSVNKTTQCTLYDPTRAARDYPAFHAIKKCMSNLNKDSYYLRRADNIISYIYSDKKTSHNNYTHLSYDDLKTKLYDTANSLFASYQIGLFADTINENYLRHVIEIIEAGATLSPQKKECDFAYDIIASDPTTLGKALALINLNSSNIAMRKKIGILCHLVKRYNDQCTTKKTPTEEQLKIYETYVVPSIWHIADNNKQNFSFPDNFDSTLLDEKIYAFNEFKQLTDMILTLLFSSEKNVQECIDQLYPPRK
jgi:hypothetical protein